MAERPNILHRSFHYTSSVETDLHKTFARVRKAMKAKAEADQHKVLPMQRETKGKKP